jgi:serine/threonine protein kinase
MDQGDEDNDGRDSEENRCIGNYELVKPIGKGKFAVVYRARNTQTNDIVALKRINVDLIDNKTRDKCLKEVKLLQSLDHPNIIRYLDSFITENDLVIIVEWAAAGDLKRQLRKQAEKNIGFDERLIWKYFSQICDAIQHMHERRVLHRDLKPANIFLTLDGTIKVGDLGLSRELSEHTIQAHSKVGTPLYMSPEVLRGDGYDFKSDIWSLGCLLYELAMLKSPFKSEGLKLYALFQKISQGDYQSVPDTYSDTLRDLTHSLLLTKPEDRPEINEICELARKMRLTTQEAYMREKSRLRRQSSSDSIPAEYEKASASPTPSNPINHNTTTSASRRNSGVYETKTDTGSGQNVKNRQAEGHVSNEMSTSKPKVKAPRDDENDSKQQQQSYQQQVPFARYSEEKPSSTMRSPSPSVVESNAGILDDNQSPTNQSTRQTPSSYRRIKPAPTSTIKSPIRIDTSTNNQSNLLKLESDANSSSPIAVPRAPKRSPKDAQIVSSEKIQRLTSAISLMDLLYTKLVLLGYTADDRKLLPMHFAVDLTAYAAKGIAGIDQGTMKQQYRKFLSVAMWLMSRIIHHQHRDKKSSSSLKAKYDDLQPDQDAPAMICKQLLTLGQVDHSSVSSLRLSL